MTLWGFLKSRTFALQLLFAVLAVGVLLTITLWVIGIYTESGRIIIVPDIKGRTVADVGTALKNIDLDYVVIDSIYRESAIKGEVVEQIPAPGKKVKKGRKIFLTINAYSPQMVIMPTLVDYSLRNAQVVMQNVGLRLGHITYRPSEYNDLVLEQHYQGAPVKPGTQMVKGSAVDLVVGQGNSAKQTVVPQLLGLTLQDAKTELKNAQLTLAAVMTDGTVTTKTDSLSAMVFKQSPSSTGTQLLPAGSGVSVWITTDAEVAVKAVTGSVK